MTTIVVTAAVIERDDRFLVTRRQGGVHLEGYWEFPGGKCDRGETHAACLSSSPIATTHAYPERLVELHFLRCELLGAPAPQMGQEMRWVPRDELGALRFPPADAELIRLLCEQD